MMTLTPVLSALKLDSPIAVHSAPLISPFGDAGSLH